MQLDLTWVDITIRLGLAALAGMLVGYNREARSQAAGLRTTTLVCVAACLAMVLSNLLLQADEPHRADDILRMDVLRLPLGVLTGIGFIGAGAIVRREDAVIGVATAATLWFMTMVGLTLGAGQLVLGVAVTLAGLAMLWTLEWADLRIRRRFRAVLRVEAEPDRLSQTELRQLIAGCGQRVVAWAITYRDGGERYEARAELEWRGHTEDRAQPPDFLEDLAMRAGVRQVDWSPQAVSI
ncbi:MgtC/SapB family protein [Phenylobacterium sp. LjRoot219]|uniref:MgtC/SapB family protein n=1 Tax=Phenylobacterium sp. LjRoot219 TaxID=3342283 RepID=UPI003ECD9454